METGTDIFNKIEALKQFVNVMNGHGRQLLVEELRKKDCCPNELAVTFRTPVSSVSTNLKMLKEFKIVKHKRKEGRKYYSLNVERLQQYEIVLDEFIKAMS